MRSPADEGKARSADLRIPQLVQTYKLLSDGEGPRFSVRFAGCILGVVAIVAALAAVYYLGAPAHDVAQPNQLAAITTKEADGTRTDYVGYLPESFSPTLGFDPARVDAAVREWHEMHPDALVLSKTPRWAGHHLIGYEIAYRA